MKVSKALCTLITYEYFTQYECLASAKYQDTKAAFLDIDDPVKEFCELCKEFDNDTIKESFELFKKKHSNVFATYKNIVVRNIFCGSFLESITEYIKNRKSNVYTVVDECDCLSDKQWLVVEQYFSKKE